ncbi:MAG: hypothetical protein VXZ49_03230 [Planctomycetota bacterium]|nr:hypothetical protein [Planctomycetota bacterium]
MRLGQELDWRFGLGMLVLGLGVFVAGCDSKSSDEEAEGDAAVGGTMQIAVPSSFQLAVVEFKSGDGASVGRVEPVEEKTFEYTRPDGTLIDFTFEKKMLIATDADANTLFSITREGDDIRFSEMGSRDESWALRYADTDLEFSRGGGETDAILRWVQDENEYLKDEVHLLDAEGNVKARTVLEAGSTVVKGDAGEVLFSADGFSDRRPMACLSIPGMSLDQQIALAVFLAGQ